MRPEEIIRLRDNDILMLYRNRDPVKLSTMPYFARRDLRRRAAMEPASLPWTLAEGVERETPLERHTRRRAEAAAGAVNGGRSLFERVRDELREREKNAEHASAEKVEPKPMGEAKSDGWSQADPTLDSDEKAKKGQQDAPSQVKPESSAAEASDALEQSEDSLVEFDDLRKSE